MKILVVSDSHRKHEYLNIAIDYIKPDRIYHLGDAEGSEGRFMAKTDAMLEIVRGNCDLNSDLPRDVVMSVGKHVVMLTHGHAYHVDYAYDSLVAAAKEKGADYVLFGHTHVPVLTEIDGVTLLNPGSISRPRQHDRKPSYAVIEVDDAGEFKVQQYFMTPRTGSN